MNKEKKTELKIRLVGNNIKPEDISVKDFAKLISAYEQAIIGVLERDYPGKIKKNESVLSVVGVTRESLGVALQPKQAWEDKTVTTANKIHTSINNNIVGELPSKTVKNLIAIQNIAKKNKCITKLTGNKNIVNTEFTREKELHTKERPPFRGENTIYGKVIGIQIDKPRIKLKLLEGRKVSFAIKEADAKELSTSLSKTVRVKGITTWDRETYDVLDMMPYSFKVMKKTSIKERIKGLAEHLGEYWKDRNPDEYVRSLRN